MDKIKEGINDILVWKVTFKPEMKMEKDDYRQII